MSLADMCKVHRQRTASPYFWGRSAPEYGSMSRKFLVFLLDRPKTEGARPSIAFTLGGDEKPTWWICDASRPRQTRLGSFAQSNHACVCPFWVHVSGPVASASMLSVMPIVLLGVPLGLLGLRCCQAEYIT